MYLCSTAEKTIFMLISTKTAFPIALAIIQMINPTNPDTANYIN